MILLAASSVYAQSEDSVSLFNHSSSSRAFVAGQVNLIHQQHPEFFAKYSGENSLRPGGEETAWSVTAVLRGGEVTHSTDCWCGLGSAAGRGLRDALGLAGFTNVDVVRKPTLGSKPYLARLLFHQVIALGGEKIRVERN